MPELKKIRVREAKVRDIGLFKKLWLKVLDRNTQEGSLVKNTEKTINFYEQLFNAYLNDNLNGTSLFVADKGIFMGGDPGFSIDYPGKIAICWGAYVDHEDKAIHDKIMGSLWDSAVIKLKGLGFTGIFVEQYENSEVLDDYKLAAAIMYREF